MAKMTFVLSDKTAVEVDAPLGMSVLEIAQQNNVPLVGACEGALACATCHVVVDSQWYDSLPPASENEEDVLDLASSLTPTSRLGCQIIMSEELDGLKVHLIS